MKRPLLIASLVCILPTLVAKPAKFKLQPASNNHKQMRNSIASCGAQHESIEQHEINTNDVEYFECYQLKPVTQWNSTKNKHAQHQYTDHMIDKVSASFFFSEQNKISPASEHVQAGVYILPNTQVVVGASIVKPKSFKYVAFDLQSQQPILSKIYPAIQVGAGEFRPKSNVKRQGSLLGASLRYKLTPHAYIDVNHKVLNNSFNVEHRRIHMSSVGLMINS